MPVIWEALALIPKNCVIEYIECQIKWIRRCSHQYVEHITIEINNHIENNSFYIDELLVESWLWL